MENTNYRFTKMPFVMGMLMDKYCYFLLGKLLELGFINQSETFKTNNQYLHTLTGFSKKIINATLSALHRKGIITVECNGIGKGKVMNTITINFDKFTEYDNINPYEVFTNPELKIEIDNYKEDGYKVSYLSSPETKVEIQPITEIKVDLPSPVVKTDEQQDKVFDVDFLNSVEIQDDIEEEGKGEEVPATPAPPQPTDEEEDADEPVKKDIASTSGETAQMLVESAISDGYELNTDCDASEFVLNNLDAMKYLEKKHKLMIYRPVANNMYNYAINRK